MTQMRTFPNTIDHSLLLDRPASDVIGMIADAHSKIDLPEISAITYLVDQRMRHVGLPVAFTPVAVMTVVPFCAVAGDLHELDRICETMSRWLKRHRTPSGLRFAAARHLALEEAYELTMEGDEDRERKGHALLVANRRCNITIGLDRCVITASYKGDYCTVLLVAKRHRYGIMFRIPEDGPDRPARPRPTPELVA